MKKLFATALVLTILISPAASGTIITSNTANLAGGSNFVTDGQWVAQGFNTDNSTYTLDSITIAGLNTGDSSQPFQVDIYDELGGAPGNLIAIFSGPTSPSGTETYTPGITVNLSPLTAYFVVARTSGAGFYFWARTADLSELGPGSISDFSVFSRDQGASWIINSLNQPVRFEVSGTASPIAEPAALLYLLPAGVTCLLLRRRKNRAGERNQPSTHLHSV